MVILTWLKINHILVSPNEDISISGRLKLWSQMMKEYNSGILQNEELKALIKKYLISFWIVVLTFGLPVFIFIGIIAIAYLK